MTAGLRHVERALVLKGDALAGALTRVSGSDDITFTYELSYLEGVARPVATTLPLSPRPTRTHAGAVPPFFAGLLPEGRRLDALLAAARTSPDDELTLLLAVGADCVGDVRVLPEDRELPAPVADLPDPATVCFHELFEATVDPEGLLHPESLPGVQDKISANLLSLPVQRHRAAGILKLTPPHLPLLVENEHAMLRLAAAAGLAVPSTQLLTDRDGHRGLLVTRFDRRLGSHGLERIAQEDAVQLAGRWPASKYRLSARELFDAVLAVTPARQATALQLLRLFAFSYAIGNGDLHGKNVSVHAPDPDLWQLTPAYDLVCTLPYGDQSMALQMEGRDSRLRGSTFRQIGSRYGVPERAVSRMLDELVQRLEPQVETVAGIGFDDRRTSHLVRTIGTRLRELAG